MPWEKYTQKEDLIQEMDYNGTTEVVYLGEAIRGSSQFDSVWRITKLAYDSNGNVLTKLYSPLFSTFGDIWNNRVSLTYS